MSNVIGGSDGQSQVAQGLEAQTISKVTKRLVPFLVLLYIIAYLDRVNVGYAALTFKKDLALSDTAFGLGAGIFFFGYFLFEVPSNIFLEKFGARKWIARIMITWGIVSVAMALTKGETSFYILRFILGAAEAGFFPGIILYLTYWFPTVHRARIVASFMFGIPVCVIFGAPLSSLLLEMNGIGGLAGWQWLFIIEGLPAVILGFVTLNYLTDKPKDATWLQNDERAWLVNAMEKDAATRASKGPTHFAAIFTDSRVLLLALVYLGLIVGLYGVGLWLPQIVKKFGLTNLQVGFVGAIPYVFAAIVMIPWGRSSDRTGERIYHVAIPAIVGFAGLIGAAYAPTPVISLIALSVAACGILAALPTFWSLPTAILGGSAAAGGIALINSVGNLGGFLGPYLVGYIKDMTQTFEIPLIVLGCFMLASGILVLMMGPSLRKAMAGTSSK